MNDISIFVDKCSDIPNIKDYPEIKTIPIYYYFNGEDIEYGDEKNLTMREILIK